MAGSVSLGAIRWDVKSAITGAPPPAPPAPPEPIFPDEDEPEPEPEDELSSEQAVLKAVHASKSGMPVQMNTGREMRARGAVFMGKR